MLFRPEWSSVQQDSVSRGRPVPAVMPFQPFYLFLRHRFLFKVNRIFAVMVAKSHVALLCAVSAALLLENQPQTFRPHLSKHFPGRMFSQLHTTPSLHYLHQCFPPRNICIVVMKTASLQDDDRLQLCADSASHPDCAPCASCLSLLCLCPSSQSTIRCDDYCFVQNQCTVSVESTCFDDVTVALLLYVL